MHLAIICGRWTVAALEQGGLGGVQDEYSQDVTSATRDALLQNLPARLLQDVDGTHGDIVELQNSLRQVIGKVVKRSSITQSIKALVTAGVVKCGLYILDKLRGVAKRRRSATPAE